jgi:hypothetical protein
MEERRDYWLF